MSSKLKLYLGRKVIDCFHSKIDVSPIQLKQLIQIENNTDKNIHMSLSLNTLERLFGIPNAHEVLKIQPDDIIKNVQCIKDSKSKHVIFEIDRRLFVKDTIEHCTEPDSNFNKKNIVVEYSSPNIAKPFHVGHLRSTIIGNFIANLHSYYKNNVTRLNYLGDWGTQFGFIKVGIDELKYTNDVIKQNPIKLLYESYVHANKLGESDVKIREKAQQEFSKLEKGSPQILKDWERYVDYTKTELEAIYSRLGVIFDEYHRESMYNVNDIQDIIDTLTNKNILQTQPDGKKVAVVNDRNISILKSDGSSLYLTRDIAAAVDRFKKYKFDKMYYVVENGQNDHFNALKGILQKMDLPWTERLHHVKFGRIRGMSTRKGTAVFLRDILDECQELMVQKQIKSPNTKVSVADLDVSDILGVSCVIVNDLKQRRQRDYIFSWDKALQVQGDTGIKLQYTHCRLCNLEENCGVPPPNECIPEILLEQEATNLIKEIARFQDVLSLAHDQLEACILVSYLFQLCNCTSKALKTLRIKGSEKDVASQRLLMFNAARSVLHQGMCILGLKPLRKM